jgi:hypothetical protein
MDEKYEDELSFRKIIPKRIQNISEENYDSKEEFCRIVTEEVYHEDEFNPVGYSTLIILIKNLIRKKLTISDEECLSQEQIKSGIELLIDK